MTACGVLSCSKVSETTEEQLIIGMYCGECHRNCSVMVKLSKTTANADTTRAFFNWFFNQQPKVYQYFANNSGIQISDSTQEFMNQLFDELPGNINDYEQTIGCPDCADGCGIFLALGDRHWLIDTGGHEDPQLQQFVDLAIESMNKVYEEVFETGV